MWHRELEICKEAAVKAGATILDVYENAKDFKVEYKSDNSPLTIADKKANEIIVDILSKEFPDYAILSEEGKDDVKRLHNDYCFVVDPLDGTKEFIKRNGQFTVNIALAYKHKSVLGVIYVPVTGELYFAYEGIGAYKQLPLNEPQKIQVTNNIGIDNINVVASNSHGSARMDELVKKFGLTKLVNKGSSLKGCMIAAGEADVYFRFNPTMEWDTAAMQCIVEEAGGIFRQMDHSPMLYNRENSLNDKGFYIVNREENILVKEM